MKMRDRHPRRRRLDSRRQLRRELYMVLQDQHEEELDQYLAACQTLLDEYGTMAYGTRATDWWQNDLECQADDELWQKSQQIDYCWDLHAENEWMADNAQRTRADAEIERAKLFEGCRRVA